MQRDNHFTTWSLIAFALVTLFTMGCDSATSDDENAAYGGCPGGYYLCSGSCTDISNDFYNCGSCGRSCATGQTCQLGQCVGGSAVNPGIGGNTPLAGYSGNQPVAGGASTPTAGGGPASGSGGNIATSGAGGNTGTSGTGATTSVPGGGYISNGTWQGYAWLAAVESATITPEDFSATTDFPLCASGTVSADADYASLAIVGWTINQGQAEGDPKLEVTPAADGISISVSNPGASELRLQIQGQNGATDPNDRWCAIIPGNGGFIPYSGFNTECWVGGDGLAYSGEPIIEVMVLVPCLATSDVTFDFCINSLAETNADGSAVAANTGCNLGANPGEGNYELSDFTTSLVTRQGQQYVVQNNVWASDGSQQTIAGTGVAFEVTQQGNNSSGNVPVSYPSVFVGSNHGHSTSNSNLPIQVSQIQSVETGWRWSGGSGGKYNAAYDVWFSANAGGDAGNPSGAYLMVWFDDNNGSVMPMGGQSGTVSIAGQAWNRWTCPGACQNGVPVISYVLSSGSLSEWGFDLISFIDDAVSEGVVQSSWYLTNVFAGFEIWNGGVGLKTEDFCAIVS